MFMALKGNMYRLGTFLSSLGSCGQLSAFVFVVVVVLFFSVFN